MTLSTDSAALNDVFAALEATLSGVASTELFASTVVPSGAGIRCVPRRGSGATVTIVDLAGDMNVGLPSAVFESENHIDETSAAEWCVDLVTRVARFGVVKVKCRSLGRWRTITETIVFSDVDELGRLRSESSVWILETWTPWQKVRPVGFD